MLIGDHTELLAKIVLDLDTQALGCSTVYRPDYTVYAQADDTRGQCGEHRFQVGTLSLDQTLTTIGLLS
jgi:hypothetical protein